MHILEAALGSQNFTSTPISEKKKAYTTTTHFQAGGGYQNPVKTRKTISITEYFPLWPPFFRQRQVDNEQIFERCLTLPGEIQLKSIVLCFSGIEGYRAIRPQVGAKPIKTEEP